MSPDAGKNKAKGKVQAASADVYTGLLGMAVLALAATAGVVCWWSMQLYGSFFAVGQ